MRPLSIKKKIILVAAIFSAAIISIFLIQHQKDSLPPPVFPEPVYTTPRQIQFSYTVKNTTNRLVPKAELWVYGPVAQTATQKCVSISCRYAHEVIKDLFGNQILYFVLENIPPYGTRIIQIQADLMVNDLPNRLKITSPDSFIAAEKYIESEAPLIVHQSEKLKKTTAAETITAIFDWVAGHVQYEGYVSQDRGALYALKNAKGDCTEYAYLFAALARSLKIPSRVLGGYICKTNTVLKASGYHNWAEFLENNVWQLADPQNKVLREEQGDYIAMRVIAPSEDSPMKNNHRFRLEGDGLKVRMN